MKKIVKVILFITIFIILWINVFKVLWIDKESIYYFYNEPKNSLDIVFIGPSTVFDQFNTPLVYHNYGYTTGILASGNFPFPATRNMIIEAEKYQNPQLYMIDISTIVDDYSDEGGAKIRKCVDNMKFSKNRFDTIQELLHYSSIDENEIMDYTFGFLTYHNRWKNIGQANFEDIGSYYKGYLFNDVFVRIIPQENYIWKNKIGNLPIDIEEVLLKLLDYINENDLQVLFIIPKRGYYDEVNYALNATVQIIEDAGFKVLNFNTTADCSLDVKLDYVDAGHTNVYGSTKYTLFLADYIQNNYDLIDHRGDSKYQSWEEEYERFKKDFTKLTQKNYDDVLKKYGF